MFLSLTQTLPPLFKMPVKQLTLKSADGTEIYADAAGDPSKPGAVFIHGFSLSAALFDVIFADPMWTEVLYLVRTHFVDPLNSACFVVHGQEPRNVLLTPLHYQFIYSRCDMMFEGTGGAGSRMILPRGRHRDLQRISMQSSRDFSWRNRL